MARTRIHLECIPYVEKSDVVWLELELAESIVQYSYAQVKILRNVFVVILNRRFNTYSRRMSSIINSNNVNLQDFSCLTDETKKNRIINLDHVDL